jgi:outer membrane protein assembly factor BamB
MGRSRVATPQKRSAGFAIDFSGVHNDRFQVYVEEGFDMTTEPTKVSTAVAEPRSLRIWPALVLLVLFAVTKAIPYFVTEMSRGLFMFGVFGPVVCGLGIFVWWIFASGATTRERWLGPLLVILVIGASALSMDKSISGMGFLFFVVPTGVAALGLALVGLAWARPTVRLWGAVLAAVIGFGGWELMRNDGVWGDFKTSLHWRWEPTAEDKYLASLEQKGAETPPANVDVVSSETIADATWPEFRGPKRDGSVPGVAIDTDWQAHPPKEIWRRKVGPGWSSFSVAGSSIFTQEQRGSAEVIACYDAATGTERWIRESPARFWESVAGAGPRATPTLSGGRLYAVGATGLVHCLDPHNGAVIWQRDLTQDAARKPPMWGFSSSPLIVDDVVVVYAGGEGEKGVLAYDVKTGEPRWSVPAGDHSYSSPQRSTVGGRDYVLMLTNTGLSAIDPADGKNAWKYDWQFDGYRAIQPLVVEESGILLGTGLGAGTRLVDLAITDAAPEIKDRWTSLEIKPNFNDYVAHDGSLYGFDQNLFVCVDLATGKRHWKKGRYGNGQILLLPDANQILVLTEPGEIVLLRTNPEKLEELARTQVLHEKTWNHPVLVGNRLYVRNAEEAVCLELPLVEPAVETASRKTGSSEAEVTTP